MVGSSNYKLTFLFLYRFIYHTHNAHYFCAIQLALYFMQICKQHGDKKKFFFSKSSRKLLQLHVRDSLKNSRVRRFDKNFKEILDQKKLGNH